VGGVDGGPKFDHVVSVMFENRSFDNLLGRLYQPGEVASFEGVIGKERRAEKRHCGQRRQFRDPANYFPRFQSRFSVSPMHELRNSYRQVAYRGVPLGLGIIGRSQVDVAVLADVHRLRRSAGPRA